MRKCTENVLIRVSCKVWKVRQQEWKVIDERSKQKLCFRI